MTKKSTKTDANRKLKTKHQTVMPEGLKEYQRRYRNGEVKTPPLEEAFALRAQLAMETVAPNREWLTDSMVEAIMNAEGYYSSISTIPLLNISKCPIRLFEDNFDLSGVHFTQVPLSKIVQDNGENIYDQYGKSDVNRFVFTVKHCNPRYGYINPNFRLRKVSHVDKMSWDNPWKVTKAPLYNVHNKIGIFLRSGNLLGKGFYYYPILLARVTATPFTGLTIKNLEKETTRALKVWDHPSSIGREYVFSITHKDDPNNSVGYVRNPVSRRPDDLVLMKINDKERGLFYSPEAVIRAYREAIKHGVISKDEKDDYVFVRYRVVVGKPYHITHELAVSKHEYKLKTAYNNGEIKRGESYFLDRLLDDGTII